jgi:drug/metabolite transporter superfamily protein YnfA
MGPNPAAPGQHRQRHRLYAAGSGVLLAGALGYIGLVDPHNPDSAYPLCPFKLLTGWNCPACGGLRMVHDLLHGDLAASINDNIFLLVGIPLLAGWVALRRRRGQAWLPIPAVLAVAVAAIAWTVLRNLPGFPLVPTVLSG